MENLSESGTFYSGLIAGIYLCQQIALAAHDRKEPLLINKEQYYILDGTELLHNMLDTICS